ncbi:uncharacterized protein LOC120661853 [Panicum virgatum]|uniref:uncharacterized protein LOC120661853 n=1 Tax=Panicum virgatum TaxID=38727 RepID=UPI0019D4F138|nr:uncharacterized protein LOC120661853 [Panicum virgatum]
MAGLGAPSSQLGPPIHGGKEEMTLETEKSSSAEGPMAQRMLQIRQSVSFQLRTRQPLAPTPIRCVMDLNKTRFGQFGALPQSSSQPYGGMWIQNITVMDFNYLMVHEFSMVNEEDHERLGEPSLSFWWQRHTSDVVTNHLV